MVPYVRKSFYKHFKRNAKRVKDVDINLNGITDETPIDDEKYTISGDVYSYAMEDTKKELDQAVEGMFHNLKIGAL